MIAVLNGLLVVILAAGIHIWTESDEMWNLSGICFGIIHLQILLLRWDIVTDLWEAAFISASVIGLPLIVHHEIKQMRRSATLEEIDMV